jgi:hypothetical protein
VAAVLFASPFPPLADVSVAPLTGASAAGCVVSFPELPAFGSLSANAGVATLDGAAESSISSMTKAASKTAGSGLGAPSPFASRAVRSSLAFFVGLGRLAGDWVPAVLEDRERRGAVVPGVGAGCPALCLACSSAMVRSIAPLSRCPAMVC